MDKKPTTYVASKYQCAMNTAQKWAKNNGVEYIGKMYFWSEEDIARFAERPKPGRRWEKREKKQEFFVNSLDLLCAYTYN